jgi:hypothetical protein
VNVVSSTQVTATAPAGSGTVDVTVTTPAGTSAVSAADRYTYLVPGPPAVSGVEPTSGPTTGESGVEVFGSNLEGATAVSFGGVAGTIVDVNAAGTALVAVVPPGSGTVDVTVTTPEGTSPITPADEYTYTVPPPVPPAPVITGLSPSSGPTSGGTAVTITGSSLTGTTAVDFGSAAATGVSVVSDSQITATAPPGSGTVGVSVTTPGGTSAAGGAAQYSYVAPAGGSGGSGGTSAGPTTPGQPAVPVSQTGPPQVISSSSAQFTATINPEGLPTTMHFDYTVDVAGGASTAALTYDQRTPEQDVGSDFTDHTVTATVGSLLPNSTYHVRAVATNASGVTPGGDATFKTATDPPPPPPTLYKTVNATPVSGTVYVLLPVTGHTAADRASVTKGVGFIPLTEARQLPVGTTFDTTRGVVSLTSATTTLGKVQSAQFGGGLFKELQDRVAHGLTVLDLVNHANARKVCASVGKGQAQAAAAKKKKLPKTILTLLRATDNGGRFESHGTYSSATVRGTSWTMSNRCDGTLTAVKRGTVVVSDFRRHRKIVLRAGRAYLAKAP